jgi:hypothetical protein
VPTTTTRAQRTWGAAFARPGSTAAATSSPGTSSPWYLGDDRKIGEVRASDLAQARSALHELLQLLTQVRVVVLFGRKAQTGWRRARPPIDLAVLEAPHPGGRWLNGHPEDRAVIVARLQEAQRLAWN